MWKDESIIILHYIKKPLLVSGFLISIVQDFIQ
jgi:hypothetical protein